MEKFGSGQTEFLNIFRSPESEYKKFAQEYFGFFFFEPGSSFHLGV